MSTGDFSTTEEAFDLELLFSIRLRLRSLGGTTAGMSPKVEDSFSSGSLIFLPSPERAERYGASKVL